MIIRKKWKALRKDGFMVTDVWMREGWFPFGFIPLYIRDIQEREKF